MIGVKVQGLPVYTNHRYHYPSRVFLIKVVVSIEKYPDVTFLCLFIYKLSFGLSTITSSLPSHNSSFINVTVYDFNPHLNIILPSSFCRSMTLKPVPFPPFFFLSSIPVGVSVPPKNFYPSLQIEVCIDTNFCLPVSGHFYHSQGFGFGRERRETPRFELNCCQTTDR